MDFEQLHEVPLDDDDDEKLDSELDVEDHRVDSNPQYNPIIYYSFVLLGAGFLFPWNAIITAVDYWKFKFGSDIYYNFTIAYMFPNCFGVICMVLFGYKTSLYARITIGFVTFAVLVIALPLFSSPGWAILIVALLGLSDAIVQSSVYGAADLYGSLYIGAVMVGNGVSGLGIAGLRILTKASTKDNEDGYRTSVIWYFSVTCVVLVLCLIDYTLVLNSPVCRSRVSKASNKLTQKHQSNTTLMELLKQVGWFSFMVAFNFWVTLSLFPGVTASVPSTNSELNDSYWMPVIMITIFQVFDLVGRTLTRWQKMIILSPSTIPFAVFSRIIFFALMLLCVKPRIFAWDPLAFSFEALLALSNGYCATLLMMFGPSQVADNDKERASTIMVFGLVFGLSIGVATGEFINWLWLEG